MKIHSLGRMAAGGALGVALGAALPLLLLYFGDMAVAPLLMVLLLAAAPVFISMLWAWSGLAGALCQTAAVLFSGWFLGDSAGLTVALTALALPGWLFVMLTQKRLRFLTGMKAAAVLEILCLLLTVFLLWLRVGENLVDALMNVMREAFSLFPSEFIDPYLTLLGRAGLLGSAFDGTTALTAARRAELLDGIMSVTADSLKVSLPGMLFTGGAAVSILGYALPLRIEQKRGDQPEVSLPPFHEWRLDAGLILGPAFCALACMLMESAGVLGADAATAAFLALSGLLFFVQGLSAMARGLFRAGMTPGRRTGILIVSSLLLLTVVEFMGIYSALLGSKGLLTVWLQKRREKRGDNDR